MFILFSASMFLSVINESALAWEISIAFICLCSGITCIIMPAQTTALSSLPKELYADGSSVWNTLYQVSGAVGSSVAITLMSYITEESFKGGTDVREVVALSQSVNFVFYFILLLGFISLYLSFRLRKPY